MVSSIFFVHIRTMAAAFVLSAYVAPLALLLSYPRFCTSRDYILTSLADKTSAALQPAHIVPARVGVSISS